MTAAARTAKPGRPPRPRCEGCGHVFHRDGCKAKGPSGCVPLLDPATGRETGIACGVRPPCPCPWGACHSCGAPIAGASPFPLGGSPEVDIDRGSAGDPDGTWAVRQLADGTLACRPLGPGLPLPGPGEWRAREHEHQLAVKETIS